MGGRGGAPMRAQQNVPTAPVAAPSVEGRILRAYENLPQGPAGYVALADLRESLGDLPREAVDQMLREMARRRNVSVITIANRKTITPRDRAAALQIGEDLNMMIAIDRTR